MRRTGMHFRTERGTKPASAGETRLFEQPRIILPAVHDPIDVNRIIPNLIEHQKPVFDIQLVILAGRNKRRFKEGVALRERLQRAKFRQKSLLQLFC